MQIAVIGNPHARALAARPALLDELRSAIGSRAQLYVTHDLSQLDAAAASIVESGAALVVLAGGDGTWGAGISALSRASSERPLPVFALAPGGTVGTAARALSVSFGRDPVAAISRILSLESLAGATLATTPLLSIVDDRSVRRLAFTFGTGLVANFFALYDPSAKDSALADRQGIAGVHRSAGGGVFAAGKLVARVFAESFVGGSFAARVLAPIACRVDVDERTLPWSASSLVIATVLPDVGLGLRICPRAGEDPQRPHVIVSALSPRQLGPRMPRVLAGRPIVDRQESKAIRAAHFDGLVTTMRIAFGEKPGPYVVDGDLRLADSVTLTAGPIVRFLSPKSWLGRLT